MIKHAARVVSVEPGYIWVEAAVGAADCAACRLGLGCRAVGGRRVRLPYAGAAPLKIDQWVELGLAEGMFLRGVAVIYMLPLLGLIGGMLALFALFGTQPLAALGAVSGLAAGLWAARRAARRLGAAEPKLLGRTEAPSLDLPPCARARAPSK